MDSPVSTVEEIQVISRSDHDGKRVSVSGLAPSSKKHTCARKVGRPPIKRTEDGKIACLHSNCRETFANKNSRWKHLNPKYCQIHQQPCPSSFNCLVSKCIGFNAQVGDKRTREAAIGETQQALAKRQKIKEGQYYITTIICFCSNHYPVYKGVH